MRKAGVFSTMLFLSILCAGAYGILHDQVTASVSPEYFTLFKFPQFQISENMPFRTGVAFVGFFATWWTGALIGLVLGAFGLFFPDHKTMSLALKKSLFIVFCITVLFGGAGFLLGRYYVDAVRLSGWFPAGLQDKNSFVITGTIHNCSYLGGFTGLITAAVYLLVKSRKARLSHVPLSKHTYPINKLTTKTRL